MKYFVLIIFLFNTVVTQANPLCQQLFTDFKMTQIIPMKSQYIGEDKGLFFDPQTKKPWGVKYFTPQELAPYKLHIQNNKLMDYKNNLVSTAFEDKEGWDFKEGLIVLTTDYKLYFSPIEERGRLHHSSLTAGKEVLFAGMLALDHGDIYYLSDRSGHYKPNAKSVMEFINYLESLGLNLNNMKISGYATENLFDKYSMNYNEWKRGLEKHSYLFMD